MIQNYNTTGIPSSDSILNLVNQYKVVIDKFKKNSDVQIGEIGFKRDGVNVADEDRPSSSGFGFGLTGYCVSASRMLLESFQMQEFLKYRGAKAKLISIDIKEQYYGYCYNGSQNYWHTAILVSDSIEGFNYQFVIDVTIRQFGNEFINKDIWDFNTWKAKLRSPNCTHKLTDFDGVEHTIVPQNLLISNERVNDINELKFLELKNNLRRNISLNESDRRLITEFVYDKMDRINADLLTDSIKVVDHNYLNNLQNVLNKLYYETNPYEAYSILKFHNREALMNWCRKLTKNYCTPQFLMLFSSLEKACKFYDIKPEDLNCNCNGIGEYYLILEYKPNAVIFPVVESQNIDGFVLHNYEITIESLRNTGFDLGKEFNTIKCVINE